MIPFDGERMSQTAQDFIDHELVARLGATLVSVGEDFRFGHRAKGDTALLAGPGRVRDAGRADGRARRRDRLLDAHPRAGRRRRGRRGRAAARRAVRDARDRPARRQARPHARLPDREPRARPRAGRARPRHLRLPRRGAGAGGVDRRGLDRRAAHVRHRPRPARRGVPARLRRRHLRPRAAARLHRADPRRAPLRVRRGADRADAPGRGRDRTAGSAGRSFES